MVERKLEAARLKDPSGSVFIFAMSDWCETSLSELAAMFD